MFPALAYFLNRKNIFFKTTKIFDGSYLQRLKMSLGLSYLKGGGGGGGDHQLKNSYFLILIKVLNQSLFGTNFV